MSHPTPIVTSLRRGNGVRGFAARQWHGQTQTVDVPRLLQGIWDMEKEGFLKEASDFSAKLEHMGEASDQAGKALAAVDTEGEYRSYIQRHGEFLRATARALPAIEPDKMRFEDARYRQALDYYGQLVLHERNVPFLVYMVDKLGGKISDLSISTRRYFDNSVDDDTNPRANSYVTIEAEGVRALLDLVRSNSKYDAIRNGAEVSGNRGNYL